MPRKKTVGLKNEPLPYGRKIEADGTTYSIDRFTIVVRFLPDRCSLFDTLRASFDKYTGNMQIAQQMTIAHDVREKSIYGTEVYWWQFGALHAELWKNPTKKHTRSDLDMQPILRLDFNPNTMGYNPVFNALLAFLRSDAITYTWSITRCDYAWDLPQKFEDTYVLSQKSIVSYQSTTYYGRRGSSGMLRVYDKTLEQMEKHHRYIGEDITRCEWVQRFNRDFQFKFDAVCSADWSSLSGGAQVLRYVTPARISDAFRCFDRRTAAKIKKQCLSTLPFDAAHFRVLLNDYLTDYGLPSAFRQDYDAYFSSPQEQDSIVEEFLQDADTKLSP